MDKQTRWTRLITVEGNEDWIRKSKERSIVPEKGYIHSSNLGSISCIDERLEERKYPLSIDEPELIIVELTKEKVSAHTHAFCHKCRYLFPLSELDTKMDKEEDDGSGNFTVLECEDCYGEGFSSM